jgi:hypothetical protein
MPLVKSQAEKQQLLEWPLIAFDIIWTLRTIVGLFYSDFLIQLLGSGRGYQFAREKSFYVK